MAKPEGRPDKKTGRDDFAFSAKDKEDGWIAWKDCEDAGLHDTVTWGKVSEMKVGDLMLLSGFHEKGNPYRNLPELDKPEQAAIVNALERHLKMNYMAEPAEYSFHACCCCIG